MEKQKTGRFHKNCLLTISSTTPHLSAILKRKTLWRFSMKLIHLSDLHIGKRVNEISMLPDQNYILAQILSIVDEEKPDAVLIAGDVYDKTVPPAEAVTLFDDFLCHFNTA